MKPIFGRPSRFTSPQNADVVFIYDTLNLFFSVVLSKSIGMLATSDGRPSSQVYGTFNRIRSHIKKFSKPSQRVALVFVKDSVPVSKRLLFPEYKAQRDATQTLPEIEKISRMGSFYTFLGTFPSSFAITDEYEADDTIASLVSSIRKPCIVFSSDKDLWQLLGQQHRRVVSLRKSELIQDFDIEKRFSLGSLANAYKIPLYKAVMGDPSDNIPKVPRIPSKDFCSTLKSLKYQNSVEGLEKLRLGLEQLENKRAFKLLCEHMPLVMRNLSLVELNRDLKPNVEFSSGSRPDMEKILQEYECFSIYGEGKHTFLFS